ncbi:Hypothetical_protein [Hexamita inflata]|uniref:Hypothetical_protein n=1 Tax=Hexamita inflata TaxID=28002 RepID=A0AA86RL59_9EUKA|nr:Hypothetical protein HINF_LOCUS66357 [Hexamita inflata]
MVLVKQLSERSDQQVARVAQFSRLMFKRPPRTTTNPPTEFAFVHRDFGLQINQRPVHITDPYQCHKTKWEKLDQKKARNAEFVELVPALLSPGRKDEFIQKAVNKMRANRTKSVKIGTRVDKSEKDPHLMDYVLPEL